MTKLTMAAGIARGLANFVTSQGVNTEALGHASGLDLFTLDDPEARIPFERFKALLRAGQTLSGDPALALHFAELVDLSEMSIVGLLTHACETMMDAFVQIQRYNRLVHDRPGAEKRWQIGPAAEGLLWITDRRDDPNSFPEATELAFGWMLCGPRLFDQTPFCRAVHVTHKAPTYWPEYERIFRAPVTFESDRNALLIDATWPTHKVAPRRRYAFGVLSAHADELLHSLDAVSSTRGQVERMLLEVLHTGAANMAYTAAKLGVSRQTLLRRLRQEGVTFEMVLDDLRHRMSLDYLSGRRASVNETAYLVGFSDPAAFSRAFKRWTGSSPRTFKRNTGSNFGEAREGPQNLALSRWSSNVPRL
jgi:AraC-like DNA-binding protein